MNRRGFTVGFALVIAVVIAFLLLGIAAIGRTFSHQSNYISQMDETLRLAESGMNATVAQISKDPAIFDIDVSMGGNNNRWVESSSGSYKTTVLHRDNPYIGIYYIINTASRTVGGKIYMLRTHTYARISNVGEYFAAINDTVNVAHPTDLSNARIYGLKLKFQRKNDYTYSNGGGVTIPGSHVTGAPKTFVKEANFVDDSFPPVDCSVLPCDWNTSLCSPNTPPGNDIVVTNGGPNQVPVKLNAPLLLPQILPSDIIYYQGLAGTHNDVQSFTADIYPPGYNCAGGSTVVGSRGPGDTYANHSLNNADHVYYWDGNVNVQGMVHGQVLIVATGDIWITGNITSAPDVEIPPGIDASSSTAHQLVLIPGPGHKVLIADSIFTGAVPTTAIIQALILCPNGTIDPGAITSDHASKLKLNFKGSMILGQAPDFGSYFHYDDGAGTPARVYSYMDTLVTNPPPYLPAVTEVYHSLCQVVTTPGMY